VTSPASALNSETTRQSEPDETTSSADSYAEAVFALVRKIPIGRVMTYGLIAEILREELGVGGPRVVGNVLSGAGSRYASLDNFGQVGAIVGPAQDNFDVPWWRVVNVAGSPPGHYATAALAAFERERTPLKRCGDKVDLKLAIWFPGIED